MGQECQSGGVSLRVPEHRLTLSMRRIFPDGSAPTPDVNALLLADGTAVLLADGRAVTF